MRRVTRAEYKYASKVPLYHKMYFERCLGGARDALAPIAPRMCTDYPRATVARGTPSITRV